MPELVRRLRATAIRLPTDLTTAIRLTSRASRLASSADGVKALPLLSTKGIKFSERWASQKALFFLTVGRVPAILYKAGAFFPEEARMRLRGR